MSGFKRATVSISQDEYDRLREADQKLRALPEMTGESHHRIAQESAAAFQATIQEMERRQASLQHIISGMSDYVRDLEQNTSQAMAAFEAEAISNMENYAGSLWSYFDQLIADHSTQFEELILNTHRQYQQELNLLARRVRRMAGSQHKKRAIAEEWLSAAEQLDLFIRQNYYCQFFLPGRIERLEDQLDQARQNLSFGLSEAVIATSQQLYLAFSDLRVELEQLEAEWQISYAAVREALDQEFILLEQSREVPAVDLDGNPLDFTVDVEFWTERRLSDVQDKLIALQYCFEDPEQVPDTETLARWLNADLREIHQELETIVLDARISAINSQLRINIAELVVRALREQGFAMSNADYEAHDVRLGYGVQLSNLAGSEVVVEVAPAGDALGNNELIINSMDSEDRTEHELVQRWNELSQSLSTYGFDVGQYVSSGNDRPLPANRPQRTQAKRTRQNRQAR